MSTKIADIVLVRKIACILHEYCAHLQLKRSGLIKKSKSAIKGETKSIIRSAEYDSISKKKIKKIADTLFSICACCLVDNSSLIISLIYLDKLLIKSHRNFELEVVYELYTGCIFSAIKFCQDLYNLKLLPLVTGVSIRQYSKLESKILDSLEYSLFVHEETFINYSQNLSSFRLNYL